MIATILLVAVAVVLASGIYVFASGFATEAPAPELAGVQAEAHDVDSDGNTDWIKLRLDREGAHAPYSASEVTLSLLDDEGTSLFESEDTDYSSADPLLCTQAQAIDGPTTADRSCDTASELDWFEHGEAWDSGTTLYVPCQDASGDGSGPHLVTLTIRGTVVLDTSVACQQAAP